MTVYEQTAEILGLPKGTMPPELQDLVLGIRASILGAADPIPTDELIKAKQALEYRMKVWTPSRDTIDTCISIMCREGFILAEEELKERVK